jgi:uncharacterized protein
VKSDRFEADPVLQEFLAQISALKPRIERIILFGSRARDDWSPDSDYDLLLIVDKKDFALRDRLYDAVVDVLLKTGRQISLKIFPREEFERLSHLQTPFIKNVLAEGIALG